MPLNVKYSTYYYVNKVGHILKIISRSRYGILLTTSIYRTTSVCIRCELQGVCMYRDHDIMIACCRSVLVSSLIQVEISCPSAQQHDICIHIAWNTIIAPRSIVLPAPRWPRTTQFCLCPLLFCLFFVWELPFFSKILLFPLSHL